METTTNERQLGRKPKDIPNVEQGQFKDTNDENTFKWLSEEYFNNDYDDTMVDALNTLPDDERNLMILFITHKNKLAPLARYFHVSTPFIRKRINEIRHKILEAYEAMLKGEDDFQLQRYKNKKAEEEEARKRPVIQMPLYDKEPIAEYESLEDAAAAVNGMPNLIKNVCNQRASKYLGYRWLWKEDYKNKYYKTTRKWYTSK